MTLSAPLAEKAEFALGPVCRCITTVLDLLFAALEPEEPPPNRLPPPNKLLKLKEEPLELAPLLAATVELDARGSPECSVTSEPQPADCDCALLAPASVLAAFVGDEIGAALGWDCVAAEGDAAGEPLASAGGRVTPVWPYAVAR